MISERIKREIGRGTAIPTPKSTHPHLVIGWGKRSGEEALAYSMPNQKKHNKNYVKKVTASEFNQAFLQLQKTGEFTRSWFKAELPQCNNQGGCNFIAIGGIFQLLGVAKYAERGVYEATRH